MKKALLLLLTAILVLACFPFSAAEETGETKAAELFGLWKNDGGNLSWIAAAVPFSEGVVISSSALLPAKAEQVTVSDGENTWEAKAIIPDDTGMIAMVFYDPEENPKEHGKWPVLPWGTTVPAASCSVRCADETGRQDSCSVLAAEEFHRQGCRFLLLTLSETVRPGSAVRTEYGYLAGIVTAEWAEGVNRVLALPAEEIVSRLREAAVLLNNLPEWGTAPEGLNVTVEKNRVTIDWEKMTLPDKTEGETVYMVLLDTANNYLNFYPAETTERSLSLNLTPGRFYAVGPTATADKPDDVPKTFATFAVPQAKQLTEHDFHPVLTAIAEGSGEGEPTPVTEVTEELLRSGRAYFYSHSTYDVRDTESGTLLITLTDPNGVNYRYESGWYYSTEYETADIWYLPLKETGLTDALERNGYPAGAYRVAYYVNGDLADEIEFELK